MNKTITHFLIKENSSGYIWNTVAGLVNAGEAVVLSMVATRTNGLSDAGVLTIAFAVGNLFANIGKFGVRNYQVSDVKEEFSFSNYLVARMASAGMMLAASAAYVLAQVRTAGCPGEKAAILFFMCLIYLIESVEDVFWGLYQKKDALAVGAKMFCIRWGLAVAGMSLTLAFRHNLFQAMLAGLLISAVTFAYLLFLTYPHFKEPVNWKMGRQDFMVLKKCLPLFLVLFLTFYITNAPKYAIDRWLTEEAQACYGFIAMPVFVVGLLNGFIYQPALVRMSEEWERGDKEAFLKRARRQCLIILLLTLACLAGAYLLGIPALSMLYAADLSGYKAELLILLAGGGMLAAVGFFGTLMTIMRRQKWIMWGFIAASPMAAASSDYCVRRHGVLGASVLYAVLMAILAAVFAGMFCINVGDDVERGLET